jgi:hypothetical protein
MTVTAWSESRVHVVPKKQAHKRLLPPAIIGLAGTLALHSLALRAALMGSQVENGHLPDIQQPGSSLDSNAKPTESLVLIDLPKTANTDHLNVQALRSNRAVLEKTPIAVIPPDLPPPADFETLVLEEKEASDASVETGDATERARLLGIYTGQIQARVERVWRRPRSSVNEHLGLNSSADADESFQCQVQIIQDTKGYVQEVLLPNCNGTVAWQRSLVLAIQQASPLPAPPSPTVFTNSIGLSFVGVPYVAGIPEEDYESALTKTAQTAIGDRR